MNAATSADTPACHACASRTGVLQRYEHDGRVDWFHDTCVGSWLMKNINSVIFFFQGTGAPS